MARPVTAPDIVAAKGQQKLIMITAYDAPTARWGEEAGADILLVGDSLAMVVLGHENTLAVTVDEMLHHARVVARISKRPMVVGDLPFGSYQGGIEQVLDASIRFLKEAAVHAVKLEGLWPEHVHALCRAGIPVMGHLGLTPQSVHRMGGYRVQGRSIEDAENLLMAAQELEEAGCFALVLEGVPAEVATVISRNIMIPTIGIGAGAGCDGQVLVVHDLLGMSQPPWPRFVTPYTRMGETAVQAIRSWAADVRDGTTPSPDQAYSLSPEVAALWHERHGGD
jgi:3-methyl-2-oxobutanoate hydroxymethyltransferase